MRDVADRVIWAFEAEAAACLAAGAHPVGIQREVRDLGATRDRSNALRGEDQPAGAFGGDDLPADGQRGEPWRTVLPDDGVPVADEPAQRELEKQVRHHGRDGVVDPGPELGQLVAQPEAAQRRTDRRRREAVE